MDLFVKTFSKVSDCGSIGVILVLCLTTEDVVERDKDCSDNAEEALSDVLGEASKSGWVSRGTFSWSLFSAISLICPSLGTVPSSSF